MSRTSVSERKAPVTRIEAFSSPVCREPEGTDRVLRLQRGDQRHPVDAKTGELLRRELDENLLVLRPKNLDLRDVLNLQQSRAMSST